MGQFHLGLGVGGVRVRGEDVEDEAGAVEHAALQGLLHVAGLGSREFVVDDGDLDVFRLDVLVDLLQFARAEIAHARRMVHGLDKARHRHAACRLQQESQFVQVLVGAFPGLLFRGHRDQDGAFRYLFICDEIAHQYFLKPMI